jgi:hypothetical protein
MSRMASVEGTMRRVAGTAYECPEARIGLLRKSGRDIGA